MSMDIIIKPTDVCNFKCTFCSSPNISNSRTYMSADQVIHLINKYNPRTVIVNGGDPLCMPPNFYENILIYLDDNNLETCISPTTNLWDAYIHPDKWKDIFNHKKIYLTTSFQYDGNRRKGDGSPYTEDEFIKVYEKILTITHQSCISFISVLDDKSLDDYPRLVDLAKRLNTDVKANPLIQSGRASSFLHMHKIFKWYLWCMENELIPYEYNAEYISKIMKNESTPCAWNRKCYEGIRCISPEGLIHSCGVLGDEHYKNLQDGVPTYELSKWTEGEIRSKGLDKKFPQAYAFIKSECFGCELFNICNSCYIQIKQVKDSNTEEIHCNGMKQFIPKMKSLGLL